MENTDFVIEHIDEEVQVIADQPSVVTNYPANTDFFIENIDSNVISIAHSLNIEASEVNFRPANTDFFIENIDKNVIAIAESMNLSPSEVDFRPANTDFFVENIDKNLIKIAESLSLTPYEVTIHPANTDMFIENIDKNVTLIKGSTNVVTVSGEYININLPDGGKVQSAQLNGNATQTTYSGKNKIDGANPTDANFATASLSNNVITVSSTSTETVPYARWVIDGISQNDVIRYSAVIQDNNGQIALQYDNNGSWATINSSVKPYTDGTTPTTYSWTNTVNTTKVRFLLYANKTIPTGNSSSRYKNTILTVNNSDLSYEPYVGGIPAPNPDYPQPISVVTGEQTVKVVGKNLLDNTTTPITVSSGTSESPLSNGLRVSYDSGSTTTSARFVGIVVGDASQFVGKNIVAQATMTPSASNAPRLSIGLCKADGSDRQTKAMIDASGSGYYTITSADVADRPYFYLYLYANSAGGTVQAGDYIDYTDLQVEISTGTMPTSYEPYQGQSFTIDLGSTELAKIGTYQDYICNDDGTWYIHKAIGHTQKDVSINAMNSVGGASPSYQSAYGTFAIYKADWNNAGGDYDNDIALARLSTNCGQYVAQNLPANSTANNMQDGTFCQRTGTNDRIYFRFTSLIGKTGAEVKAILQAQGGAQFYYALATPTTTEITDQTLIDQLEALASASLGYGVNNIWTEIATGNAMPTLELVIEKY